MVNQSCLASERNRDTSNHPPNVQQTCSMVRTTHTSNHTESHPEGAAIEATNRIAYLKESRTPTINIYTDASSQDNGTTAWACFTKEKYEEIRGRIPNHISITLAELHAVKAALIWISRQTIHEWVIIHSDSMEALTIITKVNFHTYPEIIRSIDTTASALKQHGIQVILHWVPSHINLEGNDWANKLAHEARA